MKRILFTLTLLLLLTGCTKPAAAPDVTGRLQVHFIDVGQADCVLIQQGKHAMLIDAGNNDDADIIVSYLYQQGISHLDYAVGTHPHEDHIGSLDTVLENFTVSRLLMPRVQTNTSTFEDVLDAATGSNLSITAPRAGDSFPLGDAVLIAVSNYTGDDLNNSSIMLRLTYGDTSFLFTGDAETEAEEAAMATGLTLQSDVLKVGHHGSATSTSPAFLAAVNPTYAVISCGADNDYGHPHSETLNLLSGRQLYRTDLEGTIVAVSDGKTITFAQSPSVEAPSGEITYLLNTNSKKFHLPTCSGVADISPKNRQETAKSSEDLITAGYSPCGNCKP